MKVLEIDYNYYYYPNGITTIVDFINYTNTHFHSFLKLTHLNEENCNFPYLISEDIKEVYINVANINQIREVEAIILSQKEYDERLQQVIQQKCLDCIHYEEGTLEGHHKNLSLNGDCWQYQKK